MVLTTGITDSEARTFSIFSGPAAGETVTSGRVFSIYNFPAMTLDASEARIFLPLKRASTMDVSEARVFAIVAGRVANPKVRASTYTLDGHDYYVLRLGDAPTRVYDALTGQWPEWTSDIGTGQAEAWRPNTVFSWIGGNALADQYGSNIVAGDDTFGLLWFLDPEQPYDDNPDPTRLPQQAAIERIVTGQVLSRGRTFIPCYAIFLDGDNYGIETTDFVPSVRLETSDDQGRTFYDQGSLGLATDPAEDNPYEWTSLGQIGSPGRMFRVIDNGVFARIDSMEMNDG